MQPRYFLPVILLFGISLTAHAQGYVKFYEMTELDPPAETESFNWIQLAEDPQGDGRVSSKSDGKSLSYYYEPGSDKLWFKFELFNNPNPSAFALNVLIDTDADQSTGANWFAINKNFRLERMISYWMRINDGKLQGVNGITNAGGFQNRQWTKLSDGSVNFYLDKDDNAYIISVNRTDIADDLDTFNVMGAVGEYTSWNDDIPNSGFGTVSLEK